MARRWTVSGAIATVALVLAVSVAQAGGWATVTLDQPLGEPRAGEMIAVGFTVKQHGTAPVHQVFGQPVEPIFVARHQESGERIESRASATTIVGHFVAQVRFPRAGAWFPEVIPAPFAGTKLDPVKVLAPAGAQVGVSPSDENILGQMSSVAPDPASTGKVADTAGAIGLVSIVVIVSGIALIGGREYRRRRAMGAP